MTNVGPYALAVKYTGSISCAVHTLQPIVPHTDVVTKPSFATDDCAFVSLYNRHPSKSLLDLKRTD